MCNSYKGPVIENGVSYVGKFREWNNKSFGLLKEISQ